MQSSIICRFGVITFLALFTADSAVAEVRTWTSADGKFKVEAELISVQDDTIQLRKADGTEVTVPLEKLSPADRLFAKSRAAKSASSETKAAQADPRTPKTAATKASTS